MRYGWRIGLRRHRPAGPAVDSAVELGGAPRAGAPPCRSREPGARAAHAARPPAVGIRRGQRAQHGRLFAVDQLDHPSIWWTCIVSLWRRPPGTPGFRRSSRWSAGSPADGSPCASWIAACPRSRRASASAWLAAVISLVTAAIPLAPTAGLGLGRNFAQHLRGGGLQRQHVHACRSISSAARAPPLRSRCWWPPTAPFSCRDLTRLRRSHRPLRLHAGHRVAALTPLAACAVLWGTRSVR